MAVAELPPRVALQPPPGPMAVLSSKVRTIESRLQRRKQEAPPSLVTPAPEIVAAIPQTPPRPEQELPPVDKTPTAPVIVAETQPMLVRQAPESEPPTDGGTRPGDTPSKVPSIAPVRVRDLSQPRQPEGGQRVRDRKIPKPRGGIVLAKPPAPRQRALM